MQWRNSSERYGVAMRTTHWLAVFLIIAAWLLGLFGDNLPEGAWHNIGVFLHISAGLLVLLLLVFRLSWRLADPPPAPEKTRFGMVATRAAQFVHGVLYALMVAVPTAGITLVFARGRALNVFGLFQIPSPWERDRAFAHSVMEVHEWLAHALVILALLHAAAAIVHHVMLRDTTLRRMLPGVAR